MAYIQLGLSEQAQALLTVNRHWGLYSFKRFPYQVACAPANFQAFVERVLQGIPGTDCYIGDVLIAGKD